MIKTALVFLVLSLVTIALGLFLWSDSNSESAAEVEVEGCGIRLAVLGGLVMIISLIAIGYGIWQLL